VQYRGELHSCAGQGYFIRRYEFDDFLLRRSGAEVLKHSVRKIERRDGKWLVDGRYSATFLVGAGGTHCPVSRHVFPGGRKALVGARELEFLAGTEQVAATRVGADGEPELLLHDDFGGYSWNVSKGDWLNVGTGTAEPREVRAAFEVARAFYQDAGHLPPGAQASLDAATGYSYYLFDPANLAGCETKGALLVGDALGLAHPLTAEGILPALLSGQLAGQALAEGAPSSYIDSLGGHPVMRDYALAHDLLAAGIALRDRYRDSAPKLSIRVALPNALSRFSGNATAKGFAWLFSGRPIPYASVLRFLSHSASSLSKTKG
jgi:flavin-dependent dehydrogenase